MLTHFRPRLPGCHLNSCLDWTHLNRQKQLAEWDRLREQEGSRPDSFLLAVKKWNYGYFWWLVSPADGDYLAIGKDGQNIYVNPAQDMVIIRLGWRQGELTNGQWIKLFQYLASEIK